MNDIPWDLLFALAIPALFSVGICVVLARLPTISVSQRQSLAALGAAWSGALALFLLNEFPLQGSPVLQIPGALVICVPLLACISALLSWRGQLLNWPLYIGVVLLSVACIHGLSFPWWNRGLEGWLSLGFSLIAACLFSFFMHQGCKQAHDNNNTHNRLSIFWWALHCIACAPLLISLTAVGHAQALLVCVAPIALVGFISTPLKMPTFASNNQLILATIISVLLANASMRFVASPDDPDFIQYIIRAAGLSFCASSFLLWLSRDRHGRAQLGLRIIAAIVLLVAALASQYAYNYEAASDSEESPSNDFYYQ